jgi:hypothetical protein
MDKKDFDNLKKHEIEVRGKKIKLSMVASWALWDPDNIEDTSIIEQNVPLLNGSIVFVGLNVGNTKFLTGDWKNFHAPAKGGATRLQTLLGNTRYEGAYMTDIIKNEPTPSPVELMEKIKKGKIDVDTHIKNFIEEISLLHTDDIELFLFGRAVETLFRRYVMNQPSFAALQKKVKICQQIDHYSPRNKYFLVRAPAQLGLVPTSIQKNVLWDREK